MKNKKYLSFVCALAFLGMTSASARAFDFNIGNDILPSLLMVPNASSVYMISDEPDTKQATPSEQFIDEMGKAAISFLSNDALSQAQKRSKFQALLKRNYDMKTIGRFALGRNWSLATDAQQKEYLDLFEQMVVDVYSKRFDDYKGQRFEVRSSRDVGKKDQLVNTVILPDSGPEIEVDWRVRHKNGKHQIIDVVIEGVSMSLTQRSDFSSVIQRGGGKIEPLLNHLRNR